MYRLVRSTVLCARFSTVDSQCGRLMYCSHLYKIHPCRFFLSIFAHTPASATLVCYYIFSYFLFIFTFTFLLLYLLSLTVNRLVLLISYVSNKRRKSTQAKRAQNLGNGKDFSVGKVGINLWQGQVFVGKGSTKLGVGQGFCWNRRRTIKKKSKKKVKSVFQYNTVFKPTKCRPQGEHVTNFIQKAIYT